MANGTTISYNRAWTFPSDKDLNLWVSGGRGQVQDFDTMFQAFNGMLTIDLTGYSIKPAATYGDILDSDNLFNGLVIGQWEIVDSSAVPEPGMVSLICFGLAGLGLARRKNV